MEEMEQRLREEQDVRTLQQQELQDVHRLEALVVRPVEELWGERVSVAR